MAEMTLLTHNGQFCSGHFEIMDFGFLQLKMISVFSEGDIFAKFVI